MMQPEHGGVFIIAEAGVNHDGDMAAALALVDAAARCGADAVKFQTFRADALVSHTAPKAAYQQTTSAADESQHAMLRRLELNADQHRQLAARAAECGVMFLSTPFDEHSAAFLLDDMGLETLKIGSGNLTDGPLLLRVGRARPRVILSTGMAALDEVREALSVLAFSMTAEKTATPGRAAFKAAYESDTGQAALREKVTLLHCASAYPAPMQDANLRAMQTLRDAFGLPAGYSDHTQGAAAAIAAAALGACVIEKHLTLDKSRAGPDHAASATPDELAALIAAVRETESALGDGVKQPRAAEADVRRVARKSLTAARAVAAGEAFDMANLTAKRPGSGVSAMAYWDVLGRAALRAYAADELIDAAEASGASGVQGAQA
ncbi:MAG: N-acetylneuraminate synthase [Rhodospirillales bacterium]